MEYEDLYNAYQVCLRHKRRTEDAIKFEVNALVNLKKICDEINSRTYQCRQSYTFVTTYPKAREVFAADFADRILETYVDMRLRPIVESLVSPNVHNNRVGKGCVSATNQVMENIFELSEGYTKNCWIFKRDIKGYFPSIDKDVACKQLIELTEKHYNGDDKDDVLYIIQRIVHNHPENNCDRRSPFYKWNDIEDSKSLFKVKPNLGLPIGNLLTQLIALWYTHDIDEYERQNNIRAVRYVDDVVTVVRGEEKEAYLATLPTIRNIYSELGLRLNEKKFYCQPSGHGLAFLGSRIKNGRVFLNNRTVLRGLHQIRYLNGLYDKRKHLDEFIATVNSYLGMLKIRTERKNCERLIMEIDKSWWKYIWLDKKQWVFHIREQYSKINLIKKLYRL